MTNRIPNGFMVTSILCLTLAACTGSSIETIRHDTNSTATAGGERAATGIGYALPRGLVTIKASWDGKPGSAPKISFGDTQYLPDPAARFKARGIANIFADDVLAMTVENGMLASINVTNKDQTGAAIGKVVDFAAEALKNLTLTAATRYTPSQPKAAYDRTIVFDPFMGGQDELFKSLGLLVDVRLFGDRSFTDTGKLPGAITPKVCVHSLCYRDPVAVSIRVSDFQNNMREIVALVPDQSQVNGFDVRRSACVEAKTNLTFTKGMLTKVDLTRPSPVVGCLEIPLNVLQRIAQVPGEILKFETGNIDAERALVEAQTNYIKALEAQAAATAADAETN